MKIIQGLNGENIDVVLPQLWGVETGSWDESMASSIPKIRNRLNLFPDGLWRFVSDKGKISAYMYFIRLNNNKVSNYKTWFDFSDDGWCNNHEEKGNILFAVTIGTLEKGHGKKMFSEGISQIKNGVYPGVEAVYACSRVPTLSQYYTEAAEVDISSLQDDKLLGDPIVKMLFDVGFKPYNFCKEGFYVDKESLGFSLTMRLDIN